MKKADLERRIATLAKDNGVGFTWVGGAKHDKYLFNGVTIIVPGTVRLARCSRRRSSRTAKMRSIPSEHGE